MPRYVLLDHDHPHPHWDLMLEQAGVLWTWRLTEIPQANHPFSAERIGDHRLLYLDYEGPVGGNRGRVLCVDRGDLEWELSETTVVVARITGQMLRGVLEGVAETGSLWRFHYRTG